jgi:nitroreductase
VPLRHMMSITEAIYARQTVRAFTAEPVSEAAIHALLYAAIQAPDSADAALWAFVVIQNPAVLKDLLGSGVFEGAATLIIIYAGDTHAMSDCWLAAQNIMLAAVGMGLGTCLVEDALATLNADQWIARLDVPDAFTAAVPILIGNPATSPQAVSRKAPDILNWIG